MHDTALLVT